VIYPGARMRKTTNVNLRVSPDFKRRLSEQAAKVNRSVTNYVETVLSELWRQEGKAQKGLAKRSTKTVDDRANT
jgi:hypothetical protein